MYTSIKSESLPFATNYTESTTLSPERELNAIGKTANMVFTLDKGPYNGYSLPITSYVEPIFVKFQNLFNETIVIALGKSETVNFIYRDDQMNPVSGSPVSCWYVESGVLLKTLNSWLNNAPLIPGTEERYLPNDWRKFIGLGSYNFTFSGESSMSTLYGLPEEDLAACFITKQIWYTSRGVATFQRWARTNTDGTVPIWTSRLHDDTAPYDWDAWHKISTNDGQGTLSNKEIEFQNNKVLNTPKDLTTSNTSSTPYIFDKETDLSLNTNYMYLYLNTTYNNNPTAPYNGFETTISTKLGSGQWAYVIAQLSGSYHCIALTDTNKITFEYKNGAGWLLKDGQSLTTTDVAVNNAPISSGTTKYIPNDWRTYKGDGSFLYTYDLNNGISGPNYYGLPNNYCENVVNWCDGSRATSLVTRHDTDRSIFTKRFLSTWDLSWSTIASSSGSEIFQNKTIDYRYNILKKVPIQLDSDVTLHITNPPSTIPEGHLYYPGERSFIVSSNVIGKVITLANDQLYYGQEIEIMANDSWDRYFYIKYQCGVDTVDGQDVPHYAYIGMANGQYLRFKMFGSTWNLCDGQTLQVTHACLSDMPSGATWSPSDWREWYGSKDIHFTYNLNSNAYGLPDNGTTYEVSETWWYTYHTTAIVTKRGNPVKTFMKSCGWRTWQNDWTEITTNNGSQTLTNKTMDFGNPSGQQSNILKITPTEYAAGTYTLSPDKEMSVVGAANTYITLGTAPYVGYRLPVLGRGSFLYIKFYARGTDVCIALHNQESVTLKYLGSSEWAVESGATFSTYGTFSVPSGWPLPNDWKAFYGYGTYYFIDEGANASTYDFPDGQNCITITVTWRETSRASAYAQLTRYYYKSWLRYRDSSTWSSTWAALQTHRYVEITGDNEIATDAVIFDTTYILKGDYSVVRIPWPTNSENGSVYVQYYTGTCGYVTFRDNRGAIRCYALTTGQNVKFVRNGGSWIPESGTTFSVYQNYIDNAPYINPSDTSQGRYTISDWRWWIGNGGTYHFGYDTTTNYGLPYGNGTVTVTWSQTQRATALFQSSEYNRLYYTDNVTNDHSWESWNEVVDRTKTQILYNKEIATAYNNSASNVIKINPINIGGDATVIDELVPNGDTSYLITVEKKAVKFTGAQYRGQKVKVISNVSWGYVIINSDTCIAIPNTQTVTFVAATASTWYVESGTTFMLDGNAVSWAPTVNNVQLRPNRWSISYGYPGTYHFFYEVPSGTLNMAGSPYYCPTQYCSVDVTWKSNSRGIAYATDWTTPTNYPAQWISKMHDDSSPIEWGSWIRLITGGAASTIVNSNLTASKVLVSDANGKIAAGAIEAANVVGTNATQVLTNKTYRMGSAASGNLCSINQNGDIIATITPVKMTVTWADDGTTTDYYIIPAS